LVGRITIDRFEEDYAVCDDDALSNTYAIRRSDLPPRAKAGDTIYFKDNQWFIDAEETAARSIRISDRLARIKNRRNNP
jgi:hypothetical protein